MKPRLQALLALRENYEGWFDTFCALLYEAECDCHQCGGDGFVHRLDDLQQIVCPNCKGRCFEPGRERNLTQLLTTPDYFTHRQKARRDLRAAIAEGVMG